MYKKCMARGIHINPSDRTFFELIAQTTTCNPFSDERTELDAKIVGHRVEMFSEAHLNEVTEAVSLRVDKLESRGLAHLSRYSGRDRQLMQTIFLFGCFNEFGPDLIALTFNKASLGPPPRP